MSSRRSSTGSTGKGKNNAVAEDDDGQWEVISKKPNKNRPAAAKQWASPHAPPPAASNHHHHHFKPPHTADPKRPPPPAPARGGNLRGAAPPPSSHVDHSSSYRAPHPHTHTHTAIAPPLQHGWNWQSRPRPPPQPQPQHPPTDPQHPKPKHNHINDHDHHINDDDDEDGNNSDALDDDDDDDYDDLLSDDFDSDSSDKSHNTLKKSKWFSKFFTLIDDLKIEEVNDPEREWHCPSCQGGPGAIDWYQGLQPLMTHAKTKGGAKMKLHRKLAQLLEEELKRKGTSVVPPGEAFGRWEVLQGEEKDREIVWPPMVVIMNTQLEKDEYDKWLGMGNQELLEYFSSYKPNRARHSYGPQGHRGMSVLIFEPSARGYVDAEQLHKFFVENGVDRNAWISRRRGLYHHGGKRLLYGYLATKEDLDVFNQHSQGKSKLKYELRPFHDMVVNQIWQMSEDNQQLGWYKDKFVKEKRHSQAVEESLEKVSQRLHQTIEENRIVRLRTKMQHEEHREEMLLQEQFFKDQIKLIHESRKANEENFERLQQEEREKVKYSSAITSNAEESRQRTVEVSQFIESQDREMEDYAVQRELLTKAHEEEMNAMRKRYWEEEVALEEKFNAVLACLKEKYSPHQPIDTTE